MYNITLVGSIHKEYGKCNSDELYKLIELIKPDVIFDELPVHFFNMFFDDSFEAYYANSVLNNRHPPAVPLEIQCLRKYIGNHNAKVIPVDVDVTKELNIYQKEISQMYSTYFQNEDYKKLEDQKEAMLAQKGFNYLNSLDFLEFLEKREILEEEIRISEIQNSRLLKISNLFRNVQYHIRENAMLHNIYNYSQKNEYNQAIFLVGADHKRSLIQKITEYEKEAEFKLNWKMNLQN